MLRIWGKLIKDNKIIKDKVVELVVKNTYQEALKEAVTEICKEFDIAKPYWLNHNLEEYNNRSKTSFDENNFIEEIEFNKFEIEELDDESR